MAKKANRQVSLFLFANFNLGMNKFVLIGNKRVIRRAKVDKRIIFGFRVLTVFSMIAVGIVYINGNRMGIHFLDVLLRHPFLFGGSLLIIGILYAWIMYFKEKPNRKMLSCEVNLLSEKIVLTYFDKTYEEFNLNDIYLTSRYSKRFKKNELKVTAHLLVKSELEGESIINLFKLNTRNVYWVGKKKEIMQFVNLFKDLGRLNSL